MSPAPPPRFDPAEDARLVARCLAGERGAWDELVRRHERLVLGVARSYSLPAEDLGDVFQEVFAALFRGLPRLRDARALVRWLASTTDRIALATALRRRRERVMSVEPGEIERLPAREPWVGTELEVLEEQALVRLALEGVPERCRDLLRALYYEDPPPSYAELSRRLGVPIGSLGPTRARCLERLRLGLSALGGPPDRASGGISGRSGHTSGPEGGSGRAGRAAGGASAPGRAAEGRPSSGPRKTEKAP